MTQNCWDALPKQFLEIIDQLIAPSQKDQVLNSFCLKKPTTFRANLLKVTPKELKAKLSESNIKYQEVDWLPDAFLLVEPSKKELIETDLYKQGLIYIQSLSSMIPALVLDPKPDQIVCDLTAAPGSKTTQMAMMMQNRGQIIANDRSKVRLYKLQYNLKLQEVTNTKTNYSPGENLWKKYPQYFDKVLLDAPCSLEGRFSSIDPKSYRGWTPNKVKILSQVQKHLLRSAVSLTKPGGQIVYSTCTLSPEENEEVIDWIIQKEGSNISLDQINLLIPQKLPGVLNWRGDKYQPQVKKTVRINPSDLMEGFFIAKFTKTHSNLVGYTSLKRP